MRTQNSKVMAFSHRLWVWLMAAGIVLLFGCDDGAGGLTIDIPTILAPADAPDAYPTPEFGVWVELADGFERRQVMTLMDSRPDEMTELIEIRIDPEHFSLDIGYTAGRGQSIFDWSAREDAVLTTNGGFFTDQMLATGLIVHEGNASGTSYTRRSGMFILHNQPTDAGAQRLEIRDLDPNGFSAAEQIWSGLQTFPMLVKPGGVQAVLPDQHSGDRARRTTIGIDEDGHILFVFAVEGRMTLSDISHYLATSDLNLVYALNLDGGSSTGYVLTLPDVEEIEPAFVRMPSVVYVLQKNKDSQ